MCVASCRVEVWQEPDEPLGISIVGGRSLIKRLRNGEELKGIFIKQVLPHSPAKRTGALKTGDKILQVTHLFGVAYVCLSHILILFFLHLHLYCSKSYIYWFLPHQVGGVDLQNASHEEAVEAIRAAPSPVVFIVQSLSTTPRVINQSYKSTTETKRTDVNCTLVLHGGHQYNRYMNAISGVCKRTVTRMCVPTGFKTEPCHLHLDLP